MKGQTKEKFSLDDPKRIEIGAEILYKAYKLREASRNKREKAVFIRKAKEGYREGDLRRIPCTQALTDSLRDLISSVDKGKLAKPDGGKNTGRWLVIEKAMKIILEEREPEKVDTPAEEQVPGQIEMELAEEKKPEEHDETLGDMQIKMMRFQAEMTTKMIKAIEAAEVQICMKLDRLNDTMCMLLRAVRKE